MPAPARATSAAGSSRTTGWRPSSPCRSRCSTTLASGIYIWIVANNKERRRKGKIQLLDARDLWTPGGSADSKRSLGDKRRHLSEKQIAQIVRLYGAFRRGERSKTFKNEDFGYTRVTVERPPT